MSTTMIFILLLLISTVAAQFDKYVAGAPVPDLRAIAQKYREQLPANEIAGRYIIAQDAGREPSQTSFKLHGGKKLTDDQSADISHSLRYIRAGSCFHNGVLEVKSFRNKCPDCRWTVLEAFQFDDKLPLVNYAYVGYDPSRKMHVVGVFGEMFPAEFERVMYTEGIHSFAADDNRRKNETANRSGAISKAYYDTYRQVSDKLSRTLQFYVRQIGVEVPKRVIFVGHHTAAPVAELLAQDYQAAHPEIEVSVLTTGLSAYGDDQYEQWFAKNWAKKATRMLNTRDAMVLLHVDYDPVRSPWVRNAPVDEIVIHSYLNYVSIWMASDHTKSPWKILDNEPRLLEIHRAYDPETLLCSQTSCFNQTISHFHVDRTSKYSPHFDYYGPINCGQRIGPDEVEIESVGFSNKLGAAAPPKPPHR